MKIFPPSIGGEKSTIRLVIHKSSRDKRRPEIIDFSGKESVKPCVILRVSARVVQILCKSHSRRTAEVKKPRELWITR
jgi:hypothetical protein